MSKHTLYGTNKMSQDINPNKSNNPWGPGSRGTVIKPTTDPKTDAQMAKATPITMQDNKKAKALEKAAKVKRPSVDYQD